MFTFLRRIFGILLLLASLGLLVWGLWPTLVSEMEQSLAPGQMQLPAASENGIMSADAPPPAVPETRRVLLEYPASVREGDSDVIRLTLAADAQGNLTPTAQIGGHTTTGETVQIPNVYDTHSVQMEARLDLPGLTINPAEPVSVPLYPGQKASFAWTVQPDKVGTYGGMVWLTLRFTPLAGGEERRQALSSLALQVQVTNLLGIGGQPARLIGLVGMVLGTGTGLDAVLRGLIARLSKKRKTNSRKR